MIAALAAALTAAASDRARARALLREPLLLILLALGALGAASAAWTVGIDEDALRWGAATGGLAAVAFAAAVLVRGARDVRLAAALIALLAVAMGIVGLVAAATTDVPLAHRAAGRWRPAAVFQYSPALALLVVCALAPLVAGMTRSRSRWATLATGLGGSVAGATLVLAESRTQLAFALVLAGALLVRGPRGPVGAALALIGAAGLGAYAALGGYTPVTPPPDESERLLALGAVVLGAGGLWPAVRAALRRGLPVGALAAALLLAGAAAVAVKPAPRLIASGIAQEGAGPKPRSPGADRLDPVGDRLLHGRLEIWREAIETFADRPLYGGGADSYFFASRRHQEGNSVFFAHQLPLELAAELGIAGLLLALGLYAATGRVLWRGRAGPEAWLVLPAAAAFPAANLVDWPWHLAGLGAVWALSAGAIIAAGRNSKRPLGLSRACPDKEIA
mgnify:CR=1 FL=1